MFLSFSTFALIFASHASAHIAAWHKGMYCFGGTTGQDNPNTNEAVQPLYMLPKEQYWMHASNKCNEFPPAAGDFLELPAGGSFEVQMAGNRGQTTYSPGNNTSEWPDGNNYPEDYHSEPGCITQPNLHTHNESEAAGTAFAISYQSDIGQVSLDNLVVFTVRAHTPWKRVVSYDVPNLPACPDEGCICVWGWIPNHCGIPNMYMLPYRCKVTGTPGTQQLAPPQPPVWCEGEPDKCTKGAKQFLIFHQADGNNIDPPGYQADLQLASPAYSPKCGFADGAQTDIFVSGTVTPANNSKSEISSEPPQNATLPSNSTLLSGSPAPYKTPLPSSATPPVNNSTKSGHCPSRPSAAHKRRLVKLHH